MNLLIFKLSTALVVLFITILAGYGPLFSKRKEKQPSFQSGEALASGIFLGAALFHMLPDADSGFKELLGAHSFPYTYLLCALGFLILLFLEKVVLQLAEKKKIPFHPFPVILTFVLSFHALTTGAALGINNTFGDAIIIFIAIIAHKSSESFALAVNLKKSNLNERLIYLMFIAFALMTPLGIALASVVTDILENTHAQLLEASLNAIAAGTFLYVATIYGNNFFLRHVDTDAVKELAIMALGLVLMATLAIWL